MVCIVGVMGGWVVEEEVFGDDEVIIGVGGDL